MTLNIFDDDSIKSEKEGVPFNLERRASHADHLSEKQLIKPVGIKKGEASVYQIDISTLIEKSKIDLSPTELIETYTEWIIRNGDITREYLRDKYDRGELTHSVDNFQLHEETIKNCVDSDIAAFKRTGLPDRSLEYAGQIRATAVGQEDIKRLGEKIAGAIEIDDNAVSYHINNLYKPLLYRAVYVMEGEEMFAQGSPPYNIQKHNGKRFKSEVRIFLETAIERSPALELDKEFRDNSSKLFNILDKGEKFYKLRESEDYLKEKQYVIQSQKAHSMLPKNIENIDKTKQRVKTKKT